MDISKVYIIVLNWNGTDDTIACLSSLKLLPENNYQTILVDNGSKTSNKVELLNWCKENYANCLEYSRTQAELGGVQELEQEQKTIPPSERLVFIDNKENLGFAAGNNVALKYVLTKGRNSLALLLNNDTVVAQDFLSHLLSFCAKNPDYVACTPQIRFYKPKDKIWNCGGELTWFGNRRYFYASASVGKVPQTGFKDISFVTGCALLFKPSETGILSEQFFFGEEDFEFSLRLRESGLKMACVFDSIIYHKVGGAVATNFDHSFNRLFLHYASRLIDHKGYYKQPFRFFIKWLNMSYGMYLTNLRYRFGVKNSIVFWRKVNSFVKANNSVTKSNFEDIMKGAY